jgi:aspartyl-tRNA synthetase
MQEQTQTAQVHQPTDEPLIYISGRVCGLNYSDVYAKFKAKQLELEALKFNVINPCEIIPYDISQVDARKAAIRLLSTCDFICMLPDWEEGDFCRAEYALAIKLGMHSIEI